MPVLRLVLPRLLTLTFILSALVSIVSCSDSNDVQEDARSADAHLTTSKTYIRQGQFRAAMLETRNAIKKAPGAKTIGALAEIYIELAQFRSARSLLEQYAPHYPELNLLLAESFVSLGKFHTAQKTLLLVPTALHDSEKYALVKAKTLLGVGEKEQGHALFKTISERYRDNPTIQLTYVIATFNRNPAEGEIAFQEIVERFPESPDILLASAKRHFLQQNFSATELDLMKALHLAPTTDIMTPLKGDILNLLSKSLTQQGRFAEALPFQKLLDESNPKLQDVQTRLEEAIAAIRAGDVERGEELLEKIHQDFPNIDSAEALLGLVSLERGDVEKASDLFQHSIDPETAAPRLSAAAAMAELKLDKKEEAITILEQALQANPDSLQLQSLYGLSAIQAADKQEKAAVALEKSIALGATDFILFELLATYYFESNQLENANRVLKQAANQFHEADEQLRIFGLYLSNGKVEASRQFAAKVKTTQKDSEAGWMMGATLNIKDNNLVSATAQLQTALQLNPKSEKAWFLLGNTELHQQNWAAASKAFKQTIQLNSDSKLYLSSLLKAELQRSTDWPTMVATYENLAANDKQRVQFQDFLADYAIYKQRFDDATQLIDAIKISPASSAEQIGLLERHLISSKAQQQFTLEDVAGARQTLEEGRTRYPNSPELAFSLGAVLLKQGDLAAAQSLQQTLAKLEANVLASLLNADILAAQNKHEDAINRLMLTWSNEPDARIAESLYRLTITLKKPLNDTFLAQWQAIAPNDIRPILIQGMRAQETGTGDPQALYQTVIRISPDNVTALNNLAWMYQQDNRLEEADIMASRAVQLAPDNASILDTAGYIKLKMNNSAALALLEKALELAPNDGSIKEHYLAAKQKFQ